jgi:hypothetical protein
MSRSCVLEVFVTNEMNAMVILNLKFNNGKAMDTKTYNTVLNRHTPVVIIHCLRSSWDQL